MIMKNSDHAEDVGDVDRCERSKEEKKNIYGWENTHFVERCSTWTGSRQLNTAFPSSPVLSSCSPTERPSRCIQLTRGTDKVVKMRNNDEPSVQCRGKRTIANWKQLEHTAT